MKRIITLACASLLALGACFHGLSSLTSAQGLADLALPAETLKDQFERAPGLLARYGSLNLSTVHGETDLPEVPTYRLVAECSGAQCTSTNPDIGLSLVTGISDLVLVNDGTEAPGTGHGVTAGVMATEHMGQDVTTFGAWMHHGGFSVQTRSGMQEDINLDARSGIAGGVLADARPAGSVTRRGLVVGRPFSRENRGDRLLGDTALSYDMGAGALHADTAGVVNIDRSAAHSAPTVTLSSVTVGPDGTFAHGAAADRIHDGFYGSGHAETAGNFEQSNIVSAFGSKRSDT